MGTTDFLVGAPNADPAGRVDAGVTYVVFGNDTLGSWSEGILNLGLLADGVRGFMLRGEVAHDHNGISVSAAGDINGDGMQNLMSL